jgi:hypothetical protein
VDLDLELCYSVRLTANELHVILWPGADLEQNTLEQFICCNLLIHSHGNAWQSPGNTLIYTSVFVATETCVRYPL